MSFVEAESEAHCYDDPEGRQECEVVVKVYVPALAYGILKLESDPLGGIARVVDQGFGLASEEEARRGARQSQAVVVEAHEILDQARYCNNSQSLGNEHMKVSVEGCKGGKLTLKLTVGDMTRRVEFEFRAYLAATKGSKDEDRNDQSGGGVYVSDAGETDSVPVALTISHIAISKTKILEQLVIYYRHEDDDLP